MKTKLKSFMYSAVCAGLAFGLAGCASSGNYEKAGKTSADLKDAANRIQQASGKVDASLSSLNDLSSNPTNLVNQFTKYKTSVADLDSSARDVGAKVSAMRAQGNDYFKAWDEQLAQIKNEDIKSRSLARKNEMQERFTKIKMSYQEVSDSYKPFMQDLKDIQTALGTDLTAGGVSSIKGAVEKTNKDAAPLKTSLEALATHFKDLGVAMGSAAPAPTPPAAPK